MSRKQQFIFLATTSLFWFAMYTYPVLLSTHVTDGLGGTPAMAGMVVGSYGFTQMILRIPVGYVSDRLRKRKPFLMIGAAFTALAALGLYAAHNATTALVSRGAAGVAASTWVCFTVLFSSGQKPSERTRAMGTLSSVMYAAQLAATLLGGALAQAAGTRASFALAAVAGIACLALATQVKDAPPQTAPVTLSSILHVFKDRLLLHCAAMSILMQMVMWGTLYGFSPSWAEQVLFADPAQLGLLSTVHLIPTIVFSRLGASRIVPVLGEKRTLSIGFICIAASCVLMGQTTAFWQMLLLQALCGIGVGCVAPLMLALSGRNIAHEHQGIAMGIYQSLYGIGMFVGPMLAGWIVQAATPAANDAVALAAGYRSVFLFSGCLALAAAALAIWLPIKRPRVE